MEERVDALPFVYPDNSRATGDLGNAFFTQHAVASFSEKSLAPLMFRMDFVLVRERAINCRLTQFWRNIDCAGQKNAPMKSPADKMNRVRYINQSCLIIKTIPSRCSDRNRK